MTKYILHGGAAKRKTEANKKFFIEVTKNLADPVNVIIICYAMKKEVWEEVLEKDKVTFFNASPRKVLNLVLASDQTDVFIKQIKNADAIYIHGGDTKILKDYLSKVDNLENLLKDKIVTGSSAGALVFTKHWYENDDDTYNDGLGILNFKLFCHYTKEKNNKLEKLKKYGANIETKTLEEEKFIVINK